MALLDKKKYGILKFTVTWAIEAHSKVTPTDFCFPITLDFAENGALLYLSSGYYQGVRAAHCLAVLVLAVAAALGIVVFRCHFPQCTFNELENSTQYLCFAVWMTYFTEWPSIGTLRKLALNTKYICFPHRDVLKPIRGRRIAR